jgi:hypothetical protein
MSDYYKVPANKYSTGLRRHTFILLAQRIVLVNQVIALRLHLLYLIMVLGESSVQLRLHHGGVLPGLIEFLLQRFRPEHCIAVDG